MFAATASHALRCRRSLAACVVALLALAALPSQAAPTLTPDQQAIQLALRTLIGSRWQGIKAVEIPAHGHQPAHRWTIKDGHDPAPTRPQMRRPEEGDGSGAEGLAPLYIPPKPGEHSPGEQGSAGGPGQERKVGSLYFYEITGEGEDPATVERIGLPLSPEIAETLVTNIARFTIDKGPSIPILEGTRDGTPYTLTPAYPGGSLTVVIDQQTNLPTEVERRGADGKTRYHAVYRSLELVTDDSLFWFRDQRGLPPTIGQGPQPMEGRLGEFRDRHPNIGRLPLFKTILGRQDHLVTREGFRLIGHPRPVSALPLPAFHFVFHDGLNPLSLFALRLPTGMPAADAENRVRQRLANHISDFGANTALKRHDNWLLIAAGEFDQALLESTVTQAELRLENLTSLIPERPFRRGQGNGQGGPGGGPGGGQGGGPQGPPNGGRP